MKSCILQNNSQLEQLHKILQNEISACNGIMLAQTAYQLEIKEQKKEDAIDAYKKANILLDYWISHMSKKKFILNSIFQNVLVLNHQCQTRKSLLENNLIAEKNIGFNSLQYLPESPRMQLVLNLEPQIWLLQIVSGGIEAQICHMTKQLNVIFSKGGFLTEKIFIQTELLATSISKQKILLMKQLTNEIDKVLVIYKYTPESDLNELLVQLRNSAITLYKDYKIPNKLMSLMDKLFSKRDEIEDFIHVSQQLMKAISQLFDYLKEKQIQNFQQIDQQSKLFLLKYFKDFIFQLIIDEFFTLIVKKIKKIY